MKAIYVGNATGVVLDWLVTKIEEPEELLQNLPAATAQD